MEKLDAESTLQILDLPGEGWLGDSQRSSRPSEMSFPHHGAEISQLPQIHSRYPEGIESRFKNIGRVRYKLATSGCRLSEPGAMKIGFASGIWWLLIAFKQQFTRGDSKPRLDFGPTFLFGLDEPARSVIPKK